MGKPILYHSDMSVCAAKVRSAFAEKGVEFDGVLMNLRAGDSQTPEYIRLNPNGVVPTLLHDGVAVIESNVILEYVDDMWPQKPLRPSAPLARAKMRLWMRQLDDGVHAATGTISTCIAFRHQHLQRKPEELQAWLSAIADTARRDRSRLGVELGMDSPLFAPAVQRFEKVLLSDAYPLRFEAQRIPNYLQLAPRLGFVVRDGVGTEQIRADVPGRQQVSCHIVDKAYADYIVDVHKCPTPQGVPQFPAYSPGNHLKRRRCARPSEDADELKVY